MIRLCCASEVLPTSQGRLIVGRQIIEGEHRGNLGFQNPDHLNPNINC